MRKWAEKEWTKAQEEANLKVMLLEERAASERSLSADEYRERRAMGLARARALTHECAVDGALHIPLLLLSARGSKEQERLARGEKSEIAKTEEMRLAEQAADEADTRSAREIIEEMRVEGRVPPAGGMHSATSTALKTVAWPASNVAPRPNEKKPKSGPRRHVARESSTRYSLGAAESVV